MLKYLSKSENIAVFALLCGSQNKYDALKIGAAVFTNNLKKAYT